MNSFRFLLVLAIVVFAASCDDCDLPKEVRPPDADCDKMPMPEPSMTPEATQPPEQMNPVCNGPQSFGSGTLWKPEGDHTSKPVFLIRAEFKSEFERCEADKKSGSAGALTFTGFSNGDRQTWRADMPCVDYAGRAKSGAVRCYLDGVVCIWPLPGGPCKRHD